MSNSTVSNVRTVLFETFDLARKQKYINENFIGDIDFIYKTSHKKIHDTFSRDEVDLLWKHSGDGSIQIILIMVYTGMRIEELLSMKTENVHPEERYMIGGVKTSAGINRIIPIAQKILPFNQQPRCKHSSTVLGSYVAAHSTCLLYLLSQLQKRGMLVSLSRPLHIVKYV